MEVRRFSRMQRFQVQEGGVAVLLLMIGDG